MINTKADYEVLPACTDGVSDVSFSPTADFLAASSWDGQTRIWEVGASGAIAKAAISHDGPVLSCVWSGDGTRVFSAGADKSIRMLDINSGTTTPIVNAHDAPIKKLCWMGTANAQALVSGGWDRVIKYWDLRSPSPIGTLSIPERLYAMDVCGDVLVAATAERSVCVVNLKNPLQVFKVIASPLKWQTRSIACYTPSTTANTGFAIGSIEGRVGLQWLDEKNSSSNFAFRCHREGSHAYSINSISFHPTYGSFVTAGSDGHMNFWDKDSKQRLDSSAALGSPITATAFSRTGAYLAYTLSYDWSKGHENYQPGAKNAVMIHTLTDAEVKPRASPSANLLRRR